MPGSDRRGASRPPARCVETGEISPTTQDGYPSPAASPSRKVVQSFPCTHDWQRLNEPVEVFSKTAGGWLEGRIVGVDEQGSILVRFRVNEQTYQKAFHPDSQNIHPIGGETRESDGSSDTVSTHEPAPRTYAKSRGISERPAQSFLASVPLFHELPDEEIDLLVEACKIKQLPSEHVVMKEGQVGDAFYVIVSGEVDVFAKGHLEATLHVGDFFGEQALLHEAPRNATIVTKEATTLLALSRDRFCELSLREKLYFPNRHAVHGGEHEDIAVKPPCHKTKAERLLLASAIRANANLATFFDLDDERVCNIVDLAWKEKVEEGQRVIQEGEARANYFYVVQEGAFEVTLPSKGNKVIEVIEPGDSFGELALLYSAPRAATVTATCPSMLWVIDRKQFNEILTRSAEDIVQKHAELLDRTVFETLNEDEKLMIASHLLERTFVQGEHIIEQGDRGDAFYILYEGEVDVVKDGRVVRRLSGSEIDAQYFGERALLTRETRAATVTVRSNVAKVLWMDTESFSLLLPHFHKAHHRSPSRESVASCKGPERSPTARRIQWTDLKTLGLLGCGGFGAVELVVHHATKEHFALKALSKGYVVKCGMQASVMAEMKTQSMCDSPFVVRLHETFNGKQCLFFLLELAGGGELYVTYNRKGLHGSVKHARYYVAGAVLALAHVHSRKIIHRDLKSENLLLTGEGHVKLADFGLAKVLLGKTYTICGTPDYFAPELIGRVGYTSAVDWWTVGVLAYELMFGQTPFHAKSPPIIYAKVAKGIKHVEFRGHLSGVFESFVKSMCAHDPQQRLPMRKGGTQNIKTHAWYGGFDWDGMASSKLQPPYVPENKSVRSLRRTGLKMPPQIEYRDDGSGWDDGFATSD